MQRGRQGRNEKKETSARVEDDQELDEVARAMALTSFSSFCDTRPAEEEAKKRRRPRRKTKTAMDTETETQQPTTKQSDHRDSAEHQGSFQKKSSPMPTAAQTTLGPTLYAAPEDNAPATTTAGPSTSTSPLASLVSLSLV